MILISFDIDGTMTFGDPPGPVPVAVVEEARERGYLIGSASDRTRSEQRNLWEQHGVPVDFIGGKHHLREVRARFEALRYIHIGDTETDRMYALDAGFEFQAVQTLTEPTSLSWLEL